MRIEDAKTNWKQCKQEIKKEISFQAYQTWFSGLKLVNADHEEITLQVPNRFHYEWIDSKYGELIKSALSMQIPVPLKLISFTFIFKSWVS